MDVSQHPRCQVYGPSRGPLEGFSDSRSPRRACSSRPLQPRPFRTRPWDAGRRVPNLSAIGGCRHARSGDARSTAPVPATSVPDSSRGFSLDLFRNCLAGGDLASSVPATSVPNSSPGFPPDLPELVQSSTFQSRTWILDSRSSIFGPRNYSTFDIPISTLDAWSSILGLRFSILGPRSTFLDPQSSVLEP